MKVYGYFNIILYQTPTFRPQHTGKYHKKFELNTNTKFSIWIA